MPSRIRGRRAALALLTLIPVALGADCYRFPGNGGFDRLQYVSPNSCKARDLPAYIGMTVQGDGFYRLEISDNVQIVGGAPVEPSDARSTASRMNFPSGWRSRLPA